MATKDSWEHRFNCLAPADENCRGSWCNVDGSTITAKKRFSFVFFGDVVAIDMPRSTNSVAFRSGGARILHHYCEVDQPTTWPSSLMLDAVA
jgi:hypothetical protein